MQRHIPAVGASAYPAESPRITRLVLVDEPQRLVRDALVAAIDAAPGLSAVDGSIADATLLARVDAAVVAGSLLDTGWHRVLADGTWDDGPSPVVVITDHGPVAPSTPRPGLVVVSRATPLAADRRQAARARRAVVRVAGPPALADRARARGPRPARRRPEPDGGGPQPVDHDPHRPGPHQGHPREVGPPDRHGGGARGPAARTGAPRPRLNATRRNPIWGVRASLSVS